jgi:hypothetical protein
VPRIPVPLETMQQVKIMSLIDKSITSAVPKHVRPHPTRSCTLAGFTNEIVDWLACHRLAPFG